MGRPFDSLVDEAAEVSVEGWDFSWLHGRATEERPSWGYQRLLSGRLATATAALDIQTGGGEVLAGAGAENFPPTLVATHTYVNPIVAVLLGWSFGGEKLTGSILVSMALAIAAIALVNSGSRAAAAS